MSDYHNNSIFWVETSKINPNPFQPRRDFNQAALEDLADSIRQYGVLQPLVVTRKEEQTENGGISVHYELIAGERRLRAAKLAHLDQVPVIIRKDTDNKVKLELAIIENLQREDLNPIDRALAFEQLYKEFNLTHAQIGKKMGKSRVYVSNTLRLLSLPDEIKQALMDGKITEGHTRPLLMLSDKPEEQSTLFREINLKKLSVRDSEKIARSIAQDKVRKQKFIRDPRIRDYEKKLSENLGTRVQIEQKEKGGKITIDYFSVQDLESILASIRKIERESGKTMMDIYEKQQEENESRKVISQTGPINFMTGEINSSFSQEQRESESEEGEFFEEKEEKEVDEYYEELSSYETETEELSVYRDELPVFEKEENEDIVSYQEELPQYQSPREEELVSYKEELPEYHTHEQEELVSYHEELSVSSQEAENTSLQGEDPLGIQDLPQEVAHPFEDLSQELDEEEVKGNSQLGGYENDTVSYSASGQSYEDFKRFQQAQQQKIQDYSSNDYQQGAQNYTGYGNETSYSPQQKKKGFFGKLFG